MSARNDGLSIGYRVSYGLKMFGLTFFGPAQQSQEKDPRARLKRERLALVDAAAARRAEADGRLPGSDPSGSTP